MTRIAAWVLKAAGWKVDEFRPSEKKYVLIVAPHTSVWDFVVGRLAFWTKKMPARFLIKKEFFVGPLGWLLRKFGCIPVDRTNGATVVKSVISEMEAAKGEFHLCIAPEGTRKAVKKWKMGYHTIARALDCPVYLGYFDWGRKRVSIGERFICTDDAKADTALIQQKYEALHLTARHPEGYCTH